MRRLQLTALDGVPLVAPGNDLAALIVQSLRLSGLTLEPGDVLVVAQKIVSKSEGRYVELRSVKPSDKALALASQTGKDARVVECVLRESKGVVRARKDVLIVEHRLGWVLANAGVDASNVGAANTVGSGTVQVDTAGEQVLLLPEDPDASCAALREALRKSTGVEVGVVVNDSWGRAWRLGTIGTAIGVSGIPALVDMRGVPDLFGRALRHTEVAVADELASAASLVMGQAGEGHPVVHVRGFPYEPREGRAAELVRPVQLDLFR
jgi:coenzyme F420-0:L-glutamate ligase/coenzyme F420-1:gamma-L-glutamate ligase